MPQWLRDQGAKVLGLLISGAAFLGFVTVTGGAIVWARFWAASVPADQAVAAFPRGELIVVGAVALVVFVLLGLLAVLFVYLLSDEGRPSAQMLAGLLAIVVVEVAVAVALAEADADGIVFSALAVALALAAAYLVATKFKAADATDDHFKLKPGGRILLVVIAVATAVLAGVALDEWWVGATVGAAWLLAAVSFAVASATGSTFFWYGVSVFFSVLLFGAVMSLARVLDEPQVQPAALIRADDPHGEGVQGLYVTEDDERVYLASVAMKDCASKHVRTGEGRLFWVPRDKVVSLALGPLQDVDTAAERAPRILSDLITMRPPEPEKPEQQKAEQQEEARPVNRAPAVREEGRVTKIQPRRVKPGGRITVTGERFGREGTLKIGGQAADVDTWSDELITATVPVNAPSGPVVVNCATPESSPVATVLRGPAARITVRRLPGGRVRLDSSSSTDPDGEVVARTWRVGGRLASERTAHVLSRREARRRRVRVALRVTDADGQTDRARVTLRRGRAAT